MVAKMRSTVAVPATAAAGGRWLAGTIRYALNRILSPYPPGLRVEKIQAPHYRDYKGHRLCNNYLVAESISLVWAGGNGIMRNNACGVRQIVRVGRFYVSRKPRSFFISLFTGAVAVSAVYLVYKESPSNRARVDSFPTRRVALEHSSGHPMWASLHQEQRWNKRNNLAKLRLIGSLSRSLLLPVN